MNKTQIEIYNLRKKLRKAINDEKLFQSILIDIDNILKNEIEIKKNKNNLNI